MHSKRELEGQYHAWFGVFLVPGVHGLAGVVPFPKRSCLKPCKLSGARTELDAAVL